MKFELLLKTAPFSGTRVRPFDGKKQYLSTGDLQDDSLSFVDVTFNGKPSRADITVREGDVLFARMKGTKKVLRVTKELAGVIVSTGFAVIRPGEDCDPTYLATYLSTAYFQKEKEKYCSGAIQPAITNGGIEKLEIPLPPINDQIRIAFLLGKLEGLIAQRKRHLQQLDDLVKSVFLVMFGDPVRNEKGWGIGSLKSYGTFKNGLNFGRGESGATVRYLGVGDFKSKAKLDDIDGLGFIELNELPAGDYFLQDGDLLFVRSNGNRELVGRCMAVYPGAENVTYSGFCIRYRINDPALQAAYITHLFRSSAFRRVLFQGGQGANIQNINQQTLSGLPIPVPAEVLQKQFAVIVEKVEGIKSKYRQSLTELESLYGALSQQAFKGELDLSRVPMPVMPDEEEKPVAEEPLQTPAPQGPAINLPDSDKLLDALENAEARVALISQWLGAYLGQLGGTPFSVQNFMAAAQTRLAELHPENDFALAANDYEHIKTWVFQALAAGTLTQAFDNASNRNELKAATESNQA